MSASHTDPTAIKTDAPASVVWDVLRLWHKMHPSKKLEAHSVGGTMLAKEPRRV